MRKEKCLYHPDKRALSFCHSCGKYFCGACLTEGIEYYYCRNSSCQQAQRRDESLLLAERAEKAGKGEVAASAADMQAFLKHSFFFLLLGFPLYLGAVDVVFGPRPLSFVHMTLVAFLLGAKAFAASTVAGYVLYTIYFKTADKKQVLRRNGLTTAVVSFVIFLLSFEQMKDMNVADNATVVLAFAVCAITYAIFRAASPVLLKRSSKKEDT